MRVGIERMDLYGGRWAVPIDALVRARGGDPDYIRNRIMCDRRAVYPPWEDAVTMGVNAARRVLAGVDRDDIALLVVGTESAVDFGKPVSTWIHRHCELPANCRNFEIKHACYGGTAALRIAAMWAATSAPPGKKALVISTDMSRSPHGNSESRMVQEAGAHSPEFILGGCAVAAIVGAAPAVLDIDLDRAGYWTTEIADTFRPTSSVEEGGQLESLYSYLDALDGAYDHYEERFGAFEADAFARHIYHVPFPGMAMQAHGAALSRAGASKDEIAASFAAKVLPGLRFARRLGSSYGASTMVCMLGHLSDDTPPATGEAISVFAYGSGCQGELYSATIGPEAAALVRAADIDAHLDARVDITVAQYEHAEKLRAELVDRRDAVPDRSSLGELYEASYAGQGLLVLERVDAYRRVYTWS